MIKIGEFLSRVAEIRCGISPSVVRSLRNLKKTAKDRERILRIRDAVYEIPIG